MIAPSVAASLRVALGFRFVEIMPTTLQGAFLISPTAFADQRGFFAETSRTDQLAEHGITDEFVQDNHSRSSHGVVRGLHFAIGEGSAKLVRCARGAIWDVIVDLRRESDTYLAWEGFDLTDDNLQSLYVPRGFAHGFCVTSDVADVVYKQSAYYDAQSERAIHWSDARLAIEWPLPSDQITVSERDASAPSLEELEAELNF
jgi:dTDP-4-dehydrorhamnose 3,5-epimerase